MKEKKDKKKKNKERKRCRAQNIHNCTIQNLHIVWQLEREKRGTEGGFWASVSVMGVLGVVAVRWVVNGPENRRKNRRKGEKTEALKNYNRNYRNLTWGLSHFQSIGFSSAMMNLSPRLEHITWIYQGGRCLLQQNLQNSKSMNNMKCICRSATNSTDM